jgi:AbrB family looped-hinge helix DNA binding protein
MGKPYSSTIDSRGRVTVPKEVRRRLGLSAEDRVDFVVEAVQISLRRSRSATDVFDKYKGALATYPGSKKQINAWVRKLRDE